MLLYLTTCWAVHLLAVALAALQYYNWRSLYQCRKLVVYTATLPVAPIVVPVIALLALTSAVATVIYRRG